MNIPNILTLARILMIPLLVIVFYWYGKGGYWASIIFFIAGVTDWFDGYLARKLNQSTPLGAFLDPVADKLIVVVSLVILAEAFNSPLLTVPALIIVGREVVISALREWMADLGEKAAVSVNDLGKAKTMLQMMSITSLLSGHEHWVFSVFGYITLYIAAGLTLWSMVVYIKMAWPTLMGRDQG